MITLILAIWLVAAQPPGIQKFEQINEHLYRGAQPAEEGFKALSKMGIRTIVDLRDRAEQSHWEKQVVESLDMRFVAIPMSMHAPTDGEMAHVLSLLNASEGWPVFVHCQGGRDRPVRSSPAIGLRTMGGTIKRRTTKRDNTASVCSMLVCAATSCAIRTHHRTLALPPVRASES